RMKRYFLLIWQRAVGESTSSPERNNAQKHDQNGYMDNGLPQRRTATICLSWSRAPGPLSLSVLLQQPAHVHERETPMLFTYTSGQPTSPAIVFLHGGGVSGRMWQPQLERLADNYYCLAPDLPEHGKSIDAGPFRIDETARQVARLIDERVPGKRAHLVGLSAGGVVAL